VRGLLLTASLSIPLQACTSSPAADLGRFDGGGTMPAQLGVDPHGRTLPAGSPAVRLSATLIGESGPVTWGLTGPRMLLVPLDALLESESEHCDLVTD